MLLPADSAVGGVGTGRMARSAKKMHTKRLLLIIAILTAWPSVSLVAERMVSPHSVTAPASGNSWPMLAANPERTSWTPEEVRGDLSVEWYRPIEPYIPYKIQPIAANGKIYVSTARGLYAFNAVNGNVDWVYATELPLGHSPTIATVNGTSTAFVGGYDRKIHAVNALTGQPIPGYTAYEAGAGFETNPLVIQDSYTGNLPSIFAGNRDGFFYALDAVTGSLKWKYPTEGPILFSAAYKNGVVYFASNDAHAYALDVLTGSLVWESDQLLGQGFHSFWPVVYTNQATGTDYVVFTGAENYRMSELHLSMEETSALQSYYPTSDASPYLPITDPPVDGDWVPGTVTMDASPILEYYADYPERRTVFVLDRLTGQEYSFTDPTTGRQTYAPFTWSGVTQAGPKYPPVINGIDGVYYQQTAYEGYHRWMSRGSVVGWKFGTPYISMVAQQSGNPDTTSSDEPTAYSSGGGLVYFVLCCDREGGGFDVTIPWGQPDRDWNYWGYCLNSIAPDYQAMYNDGDSFLYNDINGWQVYSGPNLSRNGVYAKHGSTQSPPIPYNGKVYVLKGNAIIAFGPNGGGTQLSLATTVAAENAPTPLSPTELQQRLEIEIQKMLDAGHLRSGYHAAGFIDQYGGGHYIDDREFGEIFDYFQNPSDTVVTLIQALPYLSPSLQAQVKTYIQTYYGPGSEYDIARISHIGFGTGAPREAFVIPPDAYYPTNPVGIGAPHRSPLEPSETPICGWCGYWEWFPPFNFYAAWKYADLFKDPGNPTVLPRAIFDSMSDKVEAFPDIGSDRYTFLSRRPYLVHLYIAGYQGYLELQSLAGYPEDADVRNWYNQAVDLRMSNFSKDTPFEGGPWNSTWYNRSLSVARNFMFLTPEIAETMHAHLQPQVQEAIDEYNDVAPYWFVSKFDNSVGEGTLQHLYDYPALFQAKAYILKQPYDELVKYLDAPAFARGDLFYIQNLVAVLLASRFSLDVVPPIQGVDFGGVATYTIQIVHGPVFTETITLEVGASPSPDLVVDVDSPGVFPPPGGQAVVTLTDLHSEPPPESFYFYTIPMTATGGGIVQTTTIRLLVADNWFYLPTILKAGSLHFPAGSERGNGTRQGDPG
jgi:hypothetical protein